MNRRKFLSSAVALAVSPAVPAIAADPHAHLKIFDPLRMSNYDADFIESHRFSVEEIARVFRVPIQYCLPQAKMSRHWFGDARDDGPATRADVSVGGKIHCAYYDDATGIATCDAGKFVPFQGELSSE